MRLLLDTHTFLWLTSGDSQLPVAMRHLIQDSSNEKFVSLASCWEIAIKVSLGRLEIGVPLARLFHDMVEGNGLTCLTIDRNHVIELQSLPHVHGDPFDRIIVAQARVEQLVLLSRDEVLDGYAIDRIWR